MALLAITSACNQPKSSSGGSDESISASNPFLQASKLPFQAPAFDQIKDSDFKPAIEEGMKQQMAEISKIADQTEAATFENTILAIENSGQLLGRVNRIFSLITGANTNPELQKVQEEEAPKLTANNDAIYLNTKLFKRVEAVYQERAKLKLDPESLRLVEYYYQKFELAGAKLSEADKDKLKELNKEESSLSTKFSTQLLAAGKDLVNTTQQPPLQGMADRAARQKLFEASWNRAEKGDANDTRKIISRIAQIRAQQAQLLGFKNYATWKLQDQMAKTPEAVEAFFRQLVPAATAKARSEAKDIQAVIDQQKGGFKLEPWDWTYYAEQVRKAKYDLDENQVKPYFELNKVLENGVFYAATQLYGITFKERKDLPVYQEDVRVFDVMDKDGSQIGLFYGDYFKRDNKNGGAWMDNMVPQSRLMKTKPVIYNVCNFTKPAAGQPALISFDDVITMFHEFGHGLHGLFANQQYVSLSGANVARDYVEFPSQFNEHWASDPKILKNYAVHYKTGAAMPQTLLDKIKKASSFNQGYEFTEALAAADLDMQWHTLPANAALQDVDKFEAEALKKTKLDLKEVPPRYRSSYFLHIWSNGYAAGYYAYSWTSMLENDAYSWFQENGGLTRANGQRFRDMILSKGNTEDLGKMFFNFRGHQPDIKPMLVKRGLL
ncbi:peptidyl-dipeptidase Dcp [Pedobacter caeni]|uniref:Dipeptidyl carboxypeptidase n=2 Tax=Pedobacter caeni TaxID=288992 RepID=A0A1M5ACD2_9SPHI|nr:peptidyl-dipeptidase Dcp [Pedobacter caeni]